LAENTDNTNIVNPDIAARIALVQAAKRRAAGGELSMEDLDEILPAHGTRVYARNRDNRLPAKRPAHYRRSAHSS
jgi:hypothetical protein